MSLQKFLSPYRYYCQAEVDSSQSSLGVSLSDFRSALAVIIPSAMKEGFATVPDVTFDDVGALEHIRYVQRKRSSICCVLESDKKQRIAGGSWSWP